MQPEAQQHIPSGAEQLPAQPMVNPEAIPSLPPLDTSIERGGQAYEQRADAAGTQVQNTGVAQTPVQQPVQPVAPQPVQQAPQVTAPLVAADEDLIEKEWVDKAKEIIQKTSDDPHARTAQVNELQRNYLQKRYGRSVGADT